MTASGRLPDFLLLGAPKCGTSALPMCRKRSRPPASCKVYVGKAKTFCSRVRSVDCEEKVTFSST